MLRRNLFLITLLVIEIAWSQIASPLWVPRLVLMYLVGRTIYSFDYPTPFLAFVVAFMMDTWSLDVFGERAVAWLIAILVVSSIIRFFNAHHISTHLMLGFISSITAGFVHFIIWNTIFRSGTLLADVFPSMLVCGIMDGLALAIIYRFAFSPTEKRPGMFVEVYR